MTKGTAFDVRHFEAQFLNVNCYIFKRSLKFVSKDLIDNESALVQIMAWCLI